MNLIADGMEKGKRIAPVTSTAAGVREQRGQHTPQGAPPAAKHHRVVQAEHLTDARKQVVIRAQKISN